MPYPDFYNDFKKEITSDYGYFEFVEVMSLVTRVSYTNPPPAEFHHKNSFIVTSI